MKLEFGYYAVVLPRPQLFGPGNVDAAFLQAATHVTIHAGEITQVDLSLSSMR